MAKHNKSIGCSVIGDKIDQSRSVIFLFLWSMYYWNVSGSFTEVQLVALILFKILIELRKFVNVPLKAQSSLLKVATILLI